MTTETPKAVKIEGDALGVIRRLVNQHRDLVRTAENAQKAIRENHKEMWAKLAEFYPQTSEGDWKLDTKYMDNGIIMLSPDEDSGLKNIKELLARMVGEKAESDE